MRWLQIKGEKMAKSKGELYLISDLEKKGFHPLAFRYLCLLTHYRKPLYFSLEALKKAQGGYDRLKNVISDLKDDKKINKQYLVKFENAINDDLDMPKALSTTWALIRGKNAQGKIKTIKEMDKILGLNLFKKEKIEIPEEVKKNIQKREIYRKHKNWKKADELRQKIKKMGYWVEDTDKGPKVKKL
jgi:cysteinyl-tRNA synthetase